MSDTQQVIQQHIDWVYGQALRQTRDAHLAEDITQAVFVLLHEKRPHDRPEVRLTGWLFRTTCLLAREALRKQIRRDYHEKHAAALRQEHAMRPEENRWGEIVEHLDEAVAKLSSGQRALVLLRFYRGLPFAEVAQKLGMSENAAKKRMGRILEQLERTLIARGVAPGFDLGALLAVHLATRAPDGLAAGTWATVSGAHPVSPTAAALRSAARHAAMKPMAIAAVLAIAAAGAVPVYLATRPANPPRQAQTSSPTPAVAPATPPAPTPYPWLADKLVEYRFLLPDGRPAADASVIVGNAGLTRLEMTNLSLSTPPQGIRLRTDADGVVRTRRLEKGINTLYVLHADGWLCETPDRLSAGREQRLLPWSRIEGTLSDASGPMANRTVRYWGVYSHSSLDLSAYTTAATDANGRFVLDRVVAGGQCELRVDGLPWMRQLVLLPGQTLTLPIVETGTRLTGAIAAPESPFFANYPIEVKLTSKAPEDTAKLSAYQWASLPLAKKHAHIAGLKSAWEAYQKTLPDTFAAGKQYRFATMYAQPRIFVSDLPPGTWTMQVRALGYDTSDYWLDDALADVTTNVTVTAGQPSHDLGTLQMQAIQHLEPGDMLKPRTLQTPTAVEVQIPEPDVALTAVHLVGFFVLPEATRPVYEQVRKHQDVAFVELVCGNSGNADYMRYRQSQCKWPSVHLPDWGTSDLRREIGLKDYIGDGMLLILSKEGKLLVRHPAIQGKLDEAFAAARERLADPAKLASARQPKNPRPPREQLTRGASSDLAPMQMEIAPKPQPAAPAPAPVAATQPRMLDLSLVEAAQCLRAGDDKTSFVVDKQRGMAIQTREARYVTAGGRGYCIPAQGQAMTYALELAPKDAFAQIVGEMREGLARNAQPAPELDRTVDGERWLGMKTRWGTKVMVDAQLRVREVDKVTFGPPLPEDEAMFAKPAGTVLELADLIGKCLPDAKPARSWMYEGTGYRLYPLAARKRQWIAFAIAHDPSPKEVLHRSQHLQDNYQLRRQTDFWLCARIASLSAAPTQVDWYVAMPTSISPDLAGDLKFYMHPYSRPFRTGPDGKMIQDGDAPETITLALPKADEGPDLRRIAADLHQALLGCKDAPVQTRLIVDYTPMLPFNDGSSFVPAAQVTPEQFADRLAKLTGVQ